MPEGKKRNTDYEERSQASDQVMANKPQTGDRQKQTVKNWGRKAQKLWPGFVYVCFSLYHFANK